MRFYDIIRKKRDGLALAKEEINFWIKGCVSGEIPDYQTAALLMAAYIRGLNKNETVDLTESMLCSGDTLDLSDIGGIIADKHSTGGVGDKTTLIVAPIAAAAGLKVAKMSGRGLGFTGGTIDKLESIPGFRTALSLEEFKLNIRELGLAVMSQTEELVPADKILYGLRDVTATIDSLPLIASSIMSKKLALGAEIIVLDVKFGSGAFMKNLTDAEDLAKTMIEIAASLGKKATALITSMEQPLGNNIGNALEVIEAIEVLKGRGPNDLRETSLELAAEMISLSSGSGSENRKAAYLTAKGLLDDGQALAKFRSFLIAQGGDAGIIDDYQRLPRSYMEYTFTAPDDGYIYSFDTEKIGLAAMALGAGRSTKDEIIDHGAGIVLLHKVGDRVEKGQKLAYLYAENTEICLTGKSLLAKAIDIKTNKPQPIDLMAKIISQ